MLTVVVTAGMVMLPLVVAIGNAINRAVEKGSDITMEASFGPAKGRMAIRPMQPPQPSSAARKRNQA